MFFFSVVLNLDYFMIYWYVLLVQFAIIQPFYSGEIYDYTCLFQTPA